MVHFFPLHWIVLQAKDNFGDLVINSKEVNEGHKVAFMKKRVILEVQAPTS